jgi:trigger factor
MKTTLHDVSQTERELEIEAPAEELEDELGKALRAQRKQADMKGFRKGKVPLSLVKKMYGKQLGLQVAQRFVQEAFEEEVEESDEVDVLGRPEITELDYEPDSDLRAVVRFGVRPQIELKDLSGEELPRLTHELDDEDVDREVESLQRSEATLLPTDGPAGEDDYIVFDLQELDAETDTPIVGKKDEEQELFLDSPQVEDDPMLGALKEAVVGASAGETVRFTFDHAQAHGGHEGAHAHRFEVALKDVKERELPDLTDEFIQDATDGEIESVEAFRTEIRERLEDAWQQRADEALQREIVQRMRELHPVPVPPSVVEGFLDSFAEDVKRQNDGELPEGFDENVFREKNRGEARDQAHWMLLRDRVVEQHELEADDEDLDAFFEEQATQMPELDAEQLRGFYQSQPQAMDQVRQQVLSKKVVDALTERFQIADKDLETFEEELKARRAPTAESAAPEEAKADAADEPLIVT